MGGVTRLSDSQAVSGGRLPDLQLPLSLRWAAGAQRPGPSGLLGPREVEEGREAMETPYPTPPDPPLSALPGLLVSLSCSLPGGLGPLGTSVSESANQKKARASLPGSG